MPQKLEGSCHCGAVRFTCDAFAPVPYRLCTCTICRKVGGYNGSIELGAYYNTLKVEGMEHTSSYQAVKYTKKGKANGLYNSRRTFCSKCSTMLWLYDDEWPELVHPFASAIDTALVDPADLPDPQRMTICMVVSPGYDPRGPIRHTKKIVLSLVPQDSKPNYVRLPDGEKEGFRNYSSRSLEEWHRDAGGWSDSE